MVVLVFVESEYGMADDLLDLDVIPKATVRLLSLTHGGVDGA